MTEKIIFKEEIKNKRLEDLFNKLNGNGDDLPTVAFPREFPILVDVDNEKQQYLLIGDIIDPKDNGIMSIETFSNYLSKDLDISPAILMKNIGDSDTITRRINKEGLLVFDAIGGQIGITHDTSLIGNGSVTTPLGINTVIYTVKALQEGNNITIKENTDKPGTWIISSQGGSGGLDQVYHGTSLTGQGTYDNKLDVNGSIYTIKALTAGSNIVITETSPGSSNWKIDATGGSGGMTEVVHDATLSGKGIANDPLTVISGGSWEKIGEYTRISTDSKNQYLINGYFGNGNDTYFNIDFDYKTSKDSGVTWVQTSKISIGTDNRNGKGIVGSIGAYGPNNALIRLLDSRALDAGVQIPCWGDFDTTYFALVNDKITVIGGGGRAVEGTHGINVNGEDNSKYVVGLSRWDNAHPGGFSSLELRNTSSSKANLFLYDVLKDDDTEVENVVSSNLIQHDIILLKGQQEIPSHNILYCKEGDILSKGDYISVNVLHNLYDTQEDFLAITKDFIQLIPASSAIDNVARTLSCATITEKEDVIAWGDFSDAFELKDGKITLSNELEWQRNWTKGMNVEESNNMNFSTLGIDPSKGLDYMRFFVEYWEINSYTPLSSVNIYSMNDPSNIHTGAFIEAKDYQNNRIRILDSKNLIGNRHQVISVDDLGEDFLIKNYDKDTNKVYINPLTYGVKQIFAGEGIQLKGTNGNWIISSDGDGGRIVEGNKGIAVDGSQSGKYILFLDKWEQDKSDGKSTIGFKNGNITPASIYIEKLDNDSVPATRVSLEEGRMSVESFGVNESTVLNIDGSVIYSEDNPLMIINSLSNSRTRELNAEPLTQEDFNYVPSWEDFNDSQFQILNGKITFTGGSPTGNSSCYHFSYKNVPVDKASTLLMNEYTIHTEKGIIYYDNSNTSDRGYAQANKTVTVLSVYLSGGVRSIGNDINNPDKDPIHLQNTFWYRDDSDDRLVVDTVTAVVGNDNLMVITWNFYGDGDRRITEIWKERADGENYADITTTANDAYWNYLKNKHSFQDGAASTLWWKHHYCYYYKYESEVACILTFNPNLFSKLDIFNKNKYYLMFAKNPSMLEIIDYEGTLLPNQLCIPPGYWYFESGIIAMEFAIINNNELEIKKDTVQEIAHLREEIGILQKKIENFLKNKIE